MFVSTLFDSAHSLGAAGSRTPRFLGEKEPGDPSERPSKKLKRSAPEEPSSSRQPLNASARLKIRDFHILGNKKIDQLVLSRHGGALLEDAVEVYNRYGRMQTYFPEEMPAQARAQGEVFSWIVQLLHKLPPTADVKDQQKKLIGQSIRNRKKRLAVLLRQFHGFSLFGPGIDEPLLFRQGKQILQDACRTYGQPRKMEAGSPEEMQGRIRAQADMYSWIAQLLRKVPQEPTGAGEFPLFNQVLNRGKYKLARLIQRMYRIPGLRRDVLMEKLDRLFTAIKNNDEATLQQRLPDLALPGMELRTPEYMSQVYLQLPPEIRKYPWSILQDIYRWQAGPNPSGRTLLHWAAVKNRPELIQTLLQAGLPADLAMESNVALPLDDASANNSVEAGEALIKAGADANRYDGTGFTLLGKLGNHPARLDFAKMLLRNGADPNLPVKSTLETPLHLAAKVNNLEFAETLLQNGGDIHGRNRAGFTPLHMAVRERLPNMLDLLLQYKANVNETDNAGRTPLFHAVGQESSDENDEILRKLLMHKIPQPNPPESEPPSTPTLIHATDPNLPDQTGKTPLIHAVENGRIDNVIFLLEGDSHDSDDESVSFVHADVNQADANGLRPLGWALLNFPGINAEQTEQRKAMIKILKRNGGKT